MNNISSSKPCTCGLVHSKLHIKDKIWRTNLWTPCVLVVCPCKSIYTMCHCKVFHPCLLKHRVSTGSLFTLNTQSAYFGHVTQISLKILRTVVVFRAPSTSRYFCTQSPHPRFVVCSERCGRRHGVIWYYPLT